MSAFIPLKAWLSGAEIFPVIGLIKEEFIPRLSQNFLYPFSSPEAALL